MKSNAEWYAQRLNTTENVLKKYNVYKNDTFKKPPDGYIPMESIRGGGA